ncbi:uncharacterized protein LOC134826281 [Bolinopsis microptera]|uniref:uncharacterized protein LOC134826281 n=1 Tax=Bolinopsis microptera TaxID=2820187 RepID=UPI00307A4CBF
MNVGTPSAVTPIRNLECDVSEKEISLRYAMTDSITTLDVGMSDISFGSVKVGDNKYVSQYSVVSYEDDRSQTSTSNLHLLPDVESLTLHPLSGFGESNFEFTENQNSGNISEEKIDKIRRNVNLQEVGISDISFGSIKISDNTNLPQYSAVSYEEDRFQKATSNSHLLPDVESLTLPSLSGFGESNFEFNSENTLEENIGKIPSKVSLQVKCQGNKKDEPTQKDEMAKVRTSKNSLDIQLSGNISVATSESLPSVASSLKDDDNGSMNAGSNLQLIKQDLKKDSNNGRKCHSESEVLTSVKEPWIDIPRSQTATLQTTVINIDYLKIMANVDEELKSLSEDLQTVRDYQQLLRDDNADDDIKEFIEIERVLESIEEKAMAEKRLQRRFHIDAQTRDKPESSTSSTDIMPEIESGSSQESDSYTITVPPEMLDLKSLSVGNVIADYENLLQDLNSLDISKDAFKEKYEITKSELHLLGKDKDILDKIAQFRMIQTLVNQIEQKAAASQMENNHDVKFDMESSDAEIEYFAERVATSALGKIVTLGLESQQAIQCESVNETEPSVCNVDTQVSNNAFSPESLERTYSTAGRDINPYLDMMGLRKHMADNAENEPVIREIDYNPPVVKKSYLDVRSKISKLFQKSTDSTDPKGEQEAGDLASTSKNRDTISRISAFPDFLTVKTDSAERQDLVKGSLQSPSTDRANLRNNINTSCKCNDLSVKDYQKSSSDIIILLDDELLEGVATNRKVDTENFACKVIDRENEPVVQEIDRVKDNYCDVRNSISGVFRKFEPKELNETGDLVPSSSFDNQSSHLPVPPQDPNARTHRESLHEFDTSSCNECGSVAITATAVESNHATDLESLNIGIVESNQISLLDHKDKKSQLKMSCSALDGSHPAAQPFKILIPETESYADLPPHSELISESPEGLNYLASRHDHQENVDNDQDVGKPKSDDSIKKQLSKDEHMNETPCYTFSTFSFQESDIAIKTVKSMLAPPDDLNDSISRYDRQEALKKRIEMNKVDIEFDPRTNVSVIAKRLSLSVKQTFDDIVKNDEYFENYLAEMSDVNSEDFSLDVPLLNLASKSPQDEHLSDDASTSTMNEIEQLLTERTDQDSCSETVSSQKPCTVFTDEPFCKPALDQNQLLNQKEKVEIRWRKSPRQVLELLKSEKLDQVQMEHVQMEHVQMEHVQMEHVQMEHVQNMSDIKIKISELAGKNDTIIDLVTPPIQGDATKDSKQPERRSSKKAKRPKKRKILKFCF